MLHIERGSFPPPKPPGARLDTLLLICMAIITAILLTLYRMGG